MNDLVRAGIAAVLLLGLWACESELPLEQPEPEPRVVAYDTAYTIAWEATSRFADSTRIVVRDSAAFAELLEQYDYTTIPERWETDFSRYAVIIAALGVRPMGGYAICIDSVRVRDGQATVYITRSEIGFGAAIPTRPVHIVRTVIRDQPLVYVEQQRSDTRCEPSWAPQP